MKQGILLTWTTTGPLALVVGTFNGVSPHSGSFQASFTTATLDQSFATTPGESYTLSFWVAAGQLFEPQAFLTVHWNGSTVFSHVFNGPAGYTEYTLNVTASTGFYGFAIRIPLL